MKSIKLKCTYANKNLPFEVNNLYKGRERYDGTREVKLKCGKYLKLEKHDVLQIHGSDEIFFAKFFEWTRKTLKCTGLDHRNPMKKSFKVGKRYQVESGRALGGVAGYIFDEDGCRSPLFI
ncbi:hypothetical protein HOS16_gp77 [Shigella phage vB_SflS-ISF001]|uniref:Uncharacterized protein n=1 Tax=Shigella phage vB_SflS-ISF001 TaxID=2048005 RepID=A0A2D1GQB5_9CAUD|nr:hypothetical protein HOS16_gp77 [Shigella phage vB_SflS-ISF001]ATN94155.1 hypothetical protein FLXISF001_077 [Shigella phage vB_SflS-ISF001]